MPIDTIDKGVLLNGKTRRGGKIFQRHGREENDGEGKGKEEKE